MSKTSQPVCDSALRDSETKLGTILDTITDGVIAIDENGIIQLFNPAAEQLFGFERNEVLGLNVNCLMPSPDYEAHDQYIADYLRTGCKKIIGIGREVTGKRKDGSLFPLHLSIGEAFLGYKRFFVAIIHDLTARKRTEEQLLTLSRAVEQSPIAVLITDLNGMIEFVNPSFSQLTGYARSEVIGQNPSMLRSPQTPTEQYHRLWLTLFDGEEWREEIQDRKKSGELYWALQSISPVRNSSGEVTHYLSMQQDVTQQKLDKEALQASEERFRQVAEMTGEWLWEQDPEGRYIYSSSAVTQILGYLPEEILGKPYLDLLTGADKMRWINELPPTGEVREPFSRLLNRYLHKDGHEVFTESTGKPFLGENGRLVKWRGVDHDITARKQYEEERHALEIAKQIQNSLLPKAPLMVDCIQVAGVCLPATHVGGDYYDYFYSDDTLNIVIADVSGHSVGAALLMAGVRSTLKAEARRPNPSKQDHGSADILLAINELLHDDLNGSDLFISMFYLRYNPLRRHLCYSNAGHNRPLWLAANANNCEELDAEGMVIGVRKSNAFEEKCLPLQPGDKILLYTDGITEAQNRAGEFFGIARLSDLLVTQRSEPPESTIQHILEALREFCGSNSFNDDVSMVVMNIY
jgi:sigma-B regulation protein RsbU (phosphoserine phosphatase)